jgi:hypothetical protein
VNFMSVPVGLYDYVSARRLAMARAACLVACLVMLFAPVANADGQTTYRLHVEASTTSGLNQLKIAAPDIGSSALQTTNLKSTSNGEKLIKAFDTQPGVPGITGAIASGSSMTFQVWMKKTANVGTLFPRAKLFLNSAAGTSLCTATGTTAITTTLTKYTISCTTSANVTLVSATRYYLWVGANMTAGSTTTTFAAELDIEGVSGGNYDSQVTIGAVCPSADHH